MIVTCPHCGKAWRPLSREERRFIALQEQVERLFEEACELFGTDTAYIKGRSKERRHVKARQWLMLRLREMGLTLKDIGRLLGGREHATVIDGIRRQVDREIAVVNIDVTNGATQEVSQGV